MTLPKSQKQFLSEEMCIDVQHMLLHLKSLVSPSCKQNYLLDVISKYIESRTEQSLLEVFLTTTRITDSSCLEFLDTMRHAFKIFLKGGINELFLYQENEAWYPKIIIGKEIKPNDITLLPDQVVIFRGCSKSEHLNHSYGQSWSTSEKIAYNFAFQHYSSQEWYNEKDRVILKSRISKAHVYYSNQSKHEREVVLDTTKLQQITTLP